MFRGDSLQGFVLTTLVLWFLTTCSSFKLTGQSQDLDASKDVLPKFVSCMDNDTPMREMIPNPNDCQTFYLCHYKGGIDPEHTLMDCQIGHDDKPLYYNFLKCGCEEKEVSTCYNQSNPEHRKDFFYCALPYDNNDY